MPVSCVGAVRRGRGYEVEQAGWVGLWRTFWQGVVELEPAGDGSGEKLISEFTPRCVQVRAYLSVCAIRTCIHACVCVSVPYTGRFAGDGAVYVSHRFQDVEGNESNLVEAVTALPPALG